jgi:hypothetical protein
MFKILKSMGEFRLIGVEGERRNQMSEMRLGKRLQMCLFMLPKDGQITKKNMLARRYGCETVDYIP